MRKYNILSTESAIQSQIIPEKKEIWPNDGADKGKMAMTEGKSKVI